MASTAPKMTPTYGVPSRTGAWVGRPLLGRPLLVKRCKSSEINVLCVCIKDELFYNVNIRIFSKFTDKKGFEIRMGFRGKLTGLTITNHYGL